jgi:hypothetical protein
MRLRTSAAASCTLLLAALALTGCSEDDGGDAFVQPPPRLAILSVLNTRNEGWRAGDEAGTDHTLRLGCPASQALIVGFGPPDPNGDPLSLENWLLRPPSACGSRRQCGYVSLTVTAPSGVEYTAQAASAQAGVASSAFGAPAFVSGPYRFNARLLASDGTEFLVGNAPVVAEVTLNVEASAECPDDDGGTGDAGTDSDAGSDSDAGDAASLPDADTLDASDSGD